MNHDQYQEQISQLLDNEAQDDPTSLFAHLAACQECREFLQSSLRLRSGLAANVLSAPVSADRALRRRFSQGGFSKDRPAQHAWNRYVTMRFPVFVLFVCLLVAGLVLSLSGRLPFRETETVYVTRLPAVVITDGSESVQPKN